MLAFGADFKHLITGLTNFDPATGIITQEALEHVWFKECFATIEFFVCLSTLY